MNFVRSVSVFLLALMTLSLWPTILWAAQWHEVTLEGIYRDRSGGGPYLTEARSGKSQYSFSLREPVDNAGNIELIVNVFDKVFSITSDKCADLGVSERDLTEVVLPKKWRSWFYKNPRTMAVGNYYYLVCGNYHVALQILDFMRGERTGTKIDWLNTRYSTPCSVKFRFIGSAKSLEHLNALLRGSSAPIENQVIRQQKITSPPEHFYVSGVRWALVIGISEYADTQIPKLRYATRDAQSFNNWLVSQKGGKYPLTQVKLLLNERATGKAIKNSLFNWLGQALEEDIIIIYFAGHGSPQSPDRPDNLFLLPFDCDYGNIATTGFPMWDIETALKRYIKAKRVVVITDACHSGGVGKSFGIARRAGRGITINPIVAGIHALSDVGEGVCVISASDENQYSQESQAWGGGHGVFTYFLLRGLQGAADFNKNTLVTLGELTSYLSQEVRRATKNAQSPTVAGRYDPALTIGK